MTIVNKLLAHLTLILSFALFTIVLIRVLKNQKRTLNYILDGLLAMGFSGIIVIILCTKTYQADLPMIIILVVLIVKYLKAKTESEVKL